MKFIKRKDGRLQYNLELPKKPNGDRDRKCLIANSQKELKEMVADAQLKLKMGYNFKAEKLTVATYLKEWLRVYCDSKAESTKSGYSNYIYNHIIPKLGEIKLAKLLPMHITCFYNEELKKHKGKTVLQEHAILRKAFNDAIKNGLLAFNPANKVDTPKVEKFVPKIPTPDEMSILMSVCKNTIHELPVILEGYLNLRRSEVFARKWEHFEIFHIRNESTGSLKEVGKIIVNSAIVPVGKKLDYKGTKNISSTRDIIIPDKLLLVFKKYRGLPQAYMCLDEKGQPLKVTTYNGRFRNFLKKHKLPNFTPHALRHYNGTLMMELNIDPKKAATIFGHSNPTTLQNTYQHMGWGMALEVAEKINRTI